MKATPLYAGQVEISNRKRKERMQRKGWLHSVQSLPLQKEVGRGKETDGVSANRGIKRILNKACNGKVGHQDG